ncbi:MAG TPA: glycoside hydrolase family 28 protein [Terriglobia bacterium]|nr:glycoside hydrolase family 28 protein [Terriglobia bacterium]
MKIEGKNIGADRRRALQMMLGVGAGIAVPAHLWAQARGPAAPRRRPYVTPEPTPPHHSIAGGFVPSAISGVFDVRAFGARGDGRTLDTPAINRAIEAAATAGGGTVRFPAGTYLCFSIHLKSHVALYLDQGATILAAETPEGGVGGYDAAEPNAWDKYQDFGHSHWHNGLMWGEEIEDVSILGPGLIWGKGLTRGRRERGAGVGDKAISLKNCHNVTLRDISILHGGHFGVLATGVDNLCIDNLKIDTNRDGIDIDCCRNVRVLNCSVNSPWDDGICPKSSFALGYPRPTENLTITNCYVSGSFQEGTLLNGTFMQFDPSFRVPRTGRIKCGTESNGGFKNITISNCVFDGCRGLALESVDGALIEDVSISNLTMRDVVEMPIFMRLGSRLRGPSGIPVGQLRRVNISNIVVSNTDTRFASILSGIPGHEIEDVRLSNITILQQGGGTKEEATLQPPEKENAYPEPNMFGPLPAYGFYIRHVKGLEMSNIEVSYMKEDLRPAFVLNDVKGADFIHIKAQRAAGGPAFALNSVSDFNLYMSRPLADAHLETVEQHNL